MAGRSTIIFFRVFFLFDVALHFIKLKKRDFMPSGFSWLDYSEAERRKALEVVFDDPEKDTRDEFVDRLRRLTQHRRPG